MPVLFAFLHHLTAFALVAAIAIEVVLLGQKFTLESARKLRIVDRVLGTSAVLLLVVGLMRVFFFEKGAAYYFQNGAFHAKLSLFILAALLSIYSTVRFILWSKSLNQGKLPEVSSGQLRLMRGIAHFELLAIVGILLSAAMMAKGIGYFG
jgi:putative membrane protein